MPAAANVPAPGNGRACDSAWRSAGARGGLYQVLPVARTPQAVSAATRRGMLKGRYARVSGVRNRQQVAPGLWRTVREVDEGVMVPRADDFGTTLGCEVDAEVLLAHKVVHAVARRARPVAVAGDGPPRGACGRRGRAHASARVGGTAAAPALGTRCVRATREPSSLPTMCRMWCGVSAKTRTPAKVPGTEHHATHSKG